MNDLSCKILENLQQVFLFILAFYETPIFAKVLLGYGMLLGYGWNVYKFGVDSYGYHTISKVYCLVYVDLLKKVY